MGCFSSKKKKNPPQKKPTNNNLFEENFNNHSMKNNKNSQLLKDYSINHSLNDNKNNKSFEDNNVQTIAKKKKDKFISKNNIHLNQNNNYNDKRIFKSQIISSNYNINKFYPKHLSQSYNNNNIYPNHLSQSFNKNNYLYLMNYNNNKNKNIINKDINEPSNLDNKEKVIYELSEEEKDKFINEALESHNRYRKRHNSEPLKLNKDLCEIAQEYAKKIAESNNFIHSGNKYNDKPLGENIFMSNHFPISGKFTTDNWYNEIKNYNFDDPGFKEGIGHFTQLVWKSTSEVGFGIEVSTDGFYYVVANFFPAGNINSPQYFQDNVERNLIDDNNVE